MDRRKSKQIQNARVIATNIFMGLSVIAIVFVLMLIAMGFTFNESGNLEQSGLVQISSNPSGAIVEIDGDTQFGRTQISKMLSASEHAIKVTKAGYDTWQKTLSVDAGLLTRIEWARLFPLKPEKTTVTTFNEPRLTAVSNDRKRMLYLEKNSSNLINIDLQGDKNKRTKLDLATILGTNKATALTGTLSIVSWNNSNNKIVLNWTTDDANSIWYLVDLDNINNTINLTAKYSLNFSHILIANDSASKLWVVEAGKLHLVDTGNSSISATDIAGIERITNNKDVVSYVAVDPATNQREIRIYKDGESGSTKILTLDDLNANVTLAMGTYWGDEWFAYSINQKVIILSGNYPSYEKPRNNSLKNILSRELEFIPQLVSVNDSQRIAVFAGDTHVMAFDIETNDYYDSTLDSAITSINWLDDFIIWQNHENKIIIQDFDGENRRELIKKANTQLPVALSENNKWLYFFELTEEVDESASTNANSTDTGAVEGTSETKFVYTLKREKLQI